MQDTTRPTVVVLESISSDVLFGVSGGCHKRACACPAPAPAAPAPAPAGPIMQVLQMPAMVQPQPQPMPQAVPPPMPSGPEVSTRVSINGQPA
jgi:hypothetical protein